ncbi:hypothetical protein TanjilG_12681 [Lupinus angustifolius]|uniref:Uncharacterized protein n=1 Tax=Lupinus angustifolius TaxID=3871 RepID=A0A4P1QZ63_LUPAN|nr:hypothetical protein TanjilG_12681 [Lupinus angustifolius]
MEIFQLDKTVMQQSFKVDSFMNSLSTNTFGRFLIRSPCLATTQDVISHLCQSCSEPLYSQASQRTSGSLLWVA